MRLFAPQLQGLKCRQGRIRRILPGQTEIFRGEKRPANDLSDATFGSVVGLIKKLAICETFLLKLLSGRNWRTHFSNRKHKSDFLPRKFAVLNIHEQTLLRGTYRLLHLLWCIPFNLYFNLNISFISESQCQTLVVFTLACILVEPKTFTY